MSIYMISNRKVTDGEFSNKGRENAKREFRVAHCHIPEKGDKAEYDILEDHELRGYQNVLKEFDSDGDLDLSKLNGTAHMFADLYSQMLKAGSKQSDTLFFIHGFANDLDSSLEHIKSLYDAFLKPQASGIDHMVYVSWPSIGGLIGTYGDDQDDAEETGRALGGLFSKLRSFFTEIFEKGGHDLCANRIHLAAHSMGNTVLDYMLQNIPERKLFNLFGEALLLHADVRHDIFEGNGSFSRLDQLASRTHIYISRSDDVLSRISTYTKNFVKRLGHKGPKNLSALPDNTFVVDTTNVGKAEGILEASLDHWGYLKRNAVRRDIRYVLAGVDEEDIPKRRGSRKGKAFFRLKK